MSTINTEYFSGSQASLFIGDLWVDDIVQYDYNISTTSQPIYGYGSTFHDQIINGRVTIQGSFVINFREPKYLWLIVQEHTKYWTKDFLKKNKTVTDPYSSATSFSDTQQRRANIDFFFKNRDAASAEAHIKKKTAPLEDVVDGSVEHMLSHPFTMKFEYGENGIYEQLEDVKIVASSKIVDSNGQPIKEVYRFIAKKRTTKSID